MLSNTDRIDLTCCSIFPRALVRYNQKSVDMISSRALRRALPILRRTYASEAQPARVQLLMNDFRARAHAYADVNPLKPPTSQMLAISRRACWLFELSKLWCRSVRLFGLNDSDTVNSDVVRDLAPGVAKHLGAKSVTVRELVEHMQRIYCGTMTVEYDNLVCRMLAVAVR
jgi:2-oxoglutarate dehydrogenase complex dehydrogenase (E1) component-like enzyme